MRCILHLQLNRLRQDYPSVGHIAETLRQKNIQIIFAVTEEVTHLYEVQQSLYSFNIQPFIQKCIHCFQYISPGTLQLWAPQLHLHCSVWKGFHGGYIGKKYTKFTSLPSVSLNITLHLNCTLCIGFQYVNKYLFNLIIIENLLCMHIKSET